MSKLFDRYYELHIANKILTIDDLDIFFRVKGSANEAATAEITVYNLSESTMKAIESGSPLVLIAGYRDDYGIIFQGTVKRAELTIEGTDVAAEIVAVDNLAELQKHIRITIPEGSDLSDVARLVFKQAGIPIGRIEQTGITTTRPMTFRIQVCKHWTCSLERQNSGIISGMARAISFRRTILQNRSCSAARQGFWRSAE